jgi:hypothetical protein
MCSKRAETFSESFGLRIESEKYPDGSAATIVRVSNASMPSADSASDVCCFQSGPLRLNP